MKQRDTSIDALRGIAILGMVLSGSIAFNGVLPGWMYHAQVPPPLHQFNPDNFGITWVDLVFPFFLFTMGAAIPLALKEKISKTNQPLFFIKIAVKRFFLLAYFALFTQHLKAWVISSNPQSIDYLLSIFAFILLFFQLYATDYTQSKLLFFAKYCSYIIAIILLCILPFKNGKGFDFFKSDIILMVLANMALFGIIIYGFTAEKPFVRLAILPMIMAIFLSAKEPQDSWIKSFYSFSNIGSIQFNWLYQFYFLKYLFIVIPGTFAGEMLLKMDKTIQEQNLHKPKNGEVISFLIVLLLIVNLIGLYTRMLFLNFVFTVFICLVIYFLINKQSSALKGLYLPLFQAGMYLLLLGLLFESYEGGIRKDSSTYSYYFVTAGLAFLCTLSFKLFANAVYMQSVIRFFSLNGQNPMVAYVTGSLLLTPILHITGLHTYFNLLNATPILGFLKGVIYTGIVSVVTIIFTKQRWFWRT